MKNEYHEGPETWTRFQDGMRKLFQVPKSAVPEKAKPKPKVKQGAREVHRVLKEDGSFVLDLGGAYEKGVPTQSLYNFKVLIKFCDELGFFLAEDFLPVNPSKLPKPH